MASEKSWEFDESWQIGQVGPYQKAEFRWKILQGGTLVLHQSELFRRPILSIKVC